MAKAASTDKRNKWDSAWALTTTTHPNSRAIALTRICIIPDMLIGYISSSTPLSALAHPTPTPRRNHSCHKGKNKYTYMLAATTPAPVSVMVVSGLQSYEYFFELATVSAHKKHFFGQRPLFCLLFSNRRCSGLARRSDKRSFAEGDGGRCRFAKWRMQSQEFLQFLW